MAIFDELLDELNKVIAKHMPGSEDKKEEDDDDDEDEDEDDEDDDDDDDDSDDQESSETYEALYISKEATQRLAESVVPILKVSRLFFRKLVRTVLNRTPSKAFTDMNSLQLNTLNKASRSIDDHLCSLIHILKDVKKIEKYDTADALAQSIKKITDHFNSTILLLILYVIPLIPNLNDPSSQEHFQTWSSHWHHLFLSATHNCLRAADKFSAPP
jgi:hypothetical protein